MTDQNLEQQDFTQDYSGGEFQGNGSSVVVEGSDAGGEAGQDPQDSGGR